MLFEHFLADEAGHAQDEAAALHALDTFDRFARAVIAGGDTSSHALQQLGAFALTTRLPLPETPGSPLCTVHSEAPVFDGLQIALKGGQIGSAGYFVNIRDGRG